MRIICLMTLVATACGVHEEGSDVDFIGYNQVGRSPLGFLITKVHRSSWSIGYYFGEKCGVNQKEEAIKDEITKALRMWLQPIREIPSLKKRIVNKFNIKNVQQHQENANLDLLIRYGCLIDKLSSASIKKQIPFISMMKKTGTFPGSNIKRTRRWYRTGFDTFVLLHEIGHAFGLMDAYVTKGTQVNHGVNGEHHDYFWRTIGNQPPSVMAGFDLYEEFEHDFCTNFDYNICGRDHPLIDTTALLEDDKRGIVWLYQRYHSRNKNTNDCFFPDYELELLSRGGHKGCVPKNPLIFLIKNGKTEIIQENPFDFRDFINKKEMIGDQLYPLHYFAKIPDDEGAGLFYRGFLGKTKARNINVTDRRGLTPLHYAIRAGNDYTTVILIGRKRDLPTNVDRVMIADGSIIMLSRRNLPIAVDVNKKANNGMTPLHFAVQFANVVATCQLLGRKDIDLGEPSFSSSRFPVTNPPPPDIDVSIEDKWGLTPEERAHTRLRFWQRKQNQQMVKKMKDILSLFDLYRSGSLDWDWCHKEIFAW